MSAVRTLAGARVVVGVSGGIAAYKAAHVVRGLVASGADVRVIPTRSSLEFVGRATWEALSHHPVTTEVFEEVDTVAHVRLGQEADLVLVVPATADLLARVRMGRADDLLAATLLVARGPVVIAPAMHTEMWRHPATVENVEVLRSRGTIVLEPADGRLTGADSGPGRLPEPEAVLAAAAAALSAPRHETTDAVLQDLEGIRVLISAGGTREEIDPVRYLANHSSGKQGWALAHAALARGAQVTLVAANVPMETPPGAHRVDVGSAAELADAVARHRRDAQVLIMAAAVADFTPTQRSGSKIKKTEGDDSAPGISLRRTLDVLRESVVSREADPSSAPGVIVGFAAETGSAQDAALDLARHKARRKGADLLVFNDLAAGVFGSDANSVRILDGHGEDVAEVTGEKIHVAHGVLDQVVLRGVDVPWTP